MASLTAEIERQIVPAIVGPLARGIEVALQQFAPEKSGNLKKTITVRQTRNGIEIFGPPYALPLDQGTPPPSTDRRTRSHKQRYHGVLKWVTRTYIGGQAPKKIAALMGDPKGPWRVVTQYGMPGYRFIERSMQEALRNLGSGLSLPKQIEITSFD
tara:strand:- start:159 stop:626 length:468 start_codon:yes stop_codon:yes gene_type:complete